MILGMQQLSHHTCNTQSTVPGLALPAESTAQVTLGMSKSLRQEPGRRRQGAALAVAPSCGAEGSREASRESQQRRQLSAPGSSSGKRCINPGQSDAKLALCCTEAGLIHDCKPRLLRSSEDAAQR